MRNKKKIVLTDCDFSNPYHIRAIKDLINAYILDPMGGGTPLNTHQQEQLITGLKSQTNLLLLLAMYENEFAGMIVCYINFSTFLVSQMINIHDVIVLDKYHHQGIGKALLEAVIQEAAIRNCMKITLEVRMDNSAAKSLYKKYGFTACEPDMHFWVKKILKKELN